MRPKWTAVLALMALALASAVVAHLVFLRSHKVVAQFRSEGVTRTASFELPATPDRVFPLFGPIGEAEWAEGWTIEPLYSPEARPSSGMVFSTRQHGGARLVWTG